MPAMGSGTQLHALPQPLAFFCFPVLSPFPLCFNVWPSFSPTLESKKEPWPKNAQMHMEDRAVVVCSGTMMIL